MRKIDGGYQGIYNPAIWIQGISGVNGRHQMSGRCQVKLRGLVLFGTLAVVVTVASVPMAGQAPRAKDGTASQAKPWTQPRTA